MTDRIIRADERTALITALGIILGFALAFFTTWSLKDTTPDIPVVLVTEEEDAALALKASLESNTSKFPSWDTQDLFPLGGLLLGIGILMRALFRSLTPPDQEVEYYNQTIRIFMWGILVTFASATISLFL